MIRKKFRMRLLAASKKRLFPEDFKRAWVAVKGSLDIGDSEIILSELSAMEKDGLLKFSSFTQKDREHLASADKNLWLPCFVTLIRETKEKSHVWDNPDYHWHSALSFWRKLNTPERDLLAQINAWLLNSQSHISVPLNERSLEILGDEKKLARMEKNGFLFGGRLPLSKIRAFVPETPAAPMYFKKEGPALIVENRDSWRSLCEWNKEAGIYAAIVYGGGNGVNNLDLSAFPNLEYYGDLDLMGLKIPMSLSRKKEVKAAALYKRLLETNIRLSKHQGKISENLKIFVKDWLPDIWYEILDMIDQGEWIPQEALGLEKLSERLEFCQG